MKRFVAGLCGLALMLAGIAVGAVPASAHGTDPAADDATLTGRVVDAKGRALRGVLVATHELGRRSYGQAESGADGRFSLTVDVAGTYALTFGEDGFDDGAWVTTAKVPGVVPGGTTDAGRIVLRRPAGWGSSSICVTVRGAIGSDDNPTDVYLKSSRGEFVGWTTVSADEETTRRRACFTHLPSGAYRVYIPSTGQTVAVRVGKRADATATLRMKAPAKRGTLKVRVVDARGKAVSSFFDVVGSRGLRAGSGSSGEGGVVRNLPAGRYTVTVVDPGTSATYTAKATVTHRRTTTVTVRKRSTGGTVVGHVKDASGPYAARAVLKGVGTDARYETWAEDGTFVLRNVTPGRYRVTVVDAVDAFSARYTYGGYRTAYYKGTTLSRSKVVTVHEGAKVRLSTITLRP